MGGAKCGVAMAFYGNTQWKQGVPSRALYPLLH